MGLCAEDLPRLSSYINEAQQRLINAGGETGFWGNWHKVVFNVLRTDPYITLPPEYARMASIDVCGSPTRIENEWYEFLEAGIGLQQPCSDGSTGCFAGGLWWGCAMGGFDRNCVSTAYDLIPTNQYIRVYVTDSRDIGASLLIYDALDQNGNGIYSTDVSNLVNGFLLPFASPFSTSTSIVTSFSRIGKSVTFGDIVVVQVDATTGEELPLTRMKPWETNPALRRYFIKQLPNGCCNSTTSSNYAQVTAMCKLEFVPAINPTDYLIIGNIPALKEECESIRYAEMDNAAGQQMSILKHRNAIKLLNQELTHYLGTAKPAINLAPWGTAHLVNQDIGTLI